MSDFKRKLEHNQNRLAGKIKETAGKVTGNEPLELKGKMLSSKADFKKYMGVKDEIEDSREEFAGKINDRIDRNNKQINLAYWANVNNIGNSQIILHAQESLPEIYSIKKICMLIVMGRIVMQLDDHGERVYSPGNIIDVPSRTKMKIKNISSDKTAIIVMKL